MKNNEAIMYLFKEYLGCCSASYFGDKLLQCMGLILDDSDSIFKINDISKIELHYVDEGVLDFTQSLEYYYSDDFDLLLISLKDVDLLHRFNENPYISYPATFESLNRAEVKLNIYFNNDSCLPIDVDIEEEKNTQEIEIDGTSGTFIAYLAHSTNLNNQDFYELDNAIFTFSEVNQNSTNKYYVNIDSKDDIILPIDNMSTKLTLEQTRIGNKIVYNTEHSVDFAENAVGYETDGVSDGKADIGRIYKLSNGDLVNDLDYSNVQRLLGNLRYNYYISDDGVFCSVPNSRQGAIDLITKDISLIDPSSVFYTGLNGTNFDPDVYSDNHEIPHRMWIMFNNDVATEDDLFNFLREFVEYYSDESTPQEIRDCLERAKLEVVRSSPQTYPYWYEVDRDIYFNPNTSGRDISVYIDEFLKIPESGGCYFTNGTYDDWNRRHLRYFFLFSIEGSTFPSQETIDYWQQIADFFVEYDNEHFDGKWIKANSCRIPTYDKYTTVSSKDILNAEEFYGVVDVPIRNTENRGVVGSYVDNVYEDNNDILSTYQNDELIISKESLTGLEKGIVYNVVNQVSMDCEFGDGYFKYGEFIRSGYLNKINVY